MLNHLLISSDAGLLLNDFLQQQGVTVQQLPAPIANALQKLAGGKGLEFEHWWDLLEQLQAFFAVKALGLSIGQSVQLEHFGCLGYLLKSSQDLKQAFSCFERFQRLLYDGNQAQLIFTQDKTLGAVASLKWQTDYGRSRLISDELFLSALVTTAKNILQDTQLKPLKVAFPHSVEAGLAPLYQRHFGCEVLFEQPNLELSFPGEYFCLPIKGSDQHLHQLMDCQAQNLLQQAPHNDKPSQDFALEVRKILVGALQQGEPTAEFVADKLHLSLRSLHRKLKLQDLVFRDVLKQTRMLLAEQYLQDKQMNLPEIALMLGYSEQSAFNRAFKQWFGLTPKQYQQRQI